MAESLLDKIEERDNKEKLQKKSLAQETSSPKIQKPAAVNRLVVQDGVKDKSVSLKVNSSMYKVFTDICKAQGLSNNSALNMIIGDYVREKKYLLDEQ